MRKMRALWGAVAAGALFLGIGFAGCFPDGDDCEVAAAAGAVGGSDGPNCV